MENTILKLTNITKEYPGVIALDDVTFEVKAGEIHALVGENGAGKSTLIKTCSGAVIPDAGKIWIDGTEYLSMTPQLADKVGVAIIYQELNNAGDLSVAENVFLGKEIRKSFLVDKKAMVEQSKVIFERLNIDLDPQLLVKDLSVGYQQMVEIAKAVARDAKILIMDEPSAPLTNNEVENMFSLVRKLKQNGVTIIYISHRLNEIFELSDRVSVMRDGKMVSTQLTKDITKNDLIRQMVGREMVNSYPERHSKATGEILMEVDNLTGNGVKDISFQVHKGEILGFTGLIGSGRTETAELLFGVKRPTSGTIKLHNNLCHFKSPLDAIRAGIVLVPEDRKRQGALLPLSVAKNITLASLKKYSRVGIIDKKQEKTTVQYFVDRLKIKTPSMDQMVKNLSGGNQQKVVLAKGLATEPELIIFDEPTRGIDVGAKYEIYKLMNQLIDEGKTIIIISSEMEELIGMADRLIVFAEGTLTGELKKQDFNQETIMKYASKEKVCDDK